MEQNLDVICVTTLRPKLLQKTLSSFVTKMFKGSIPQIRLILYVEQKYCHDEKEKIELTNEIFGIVSSFHFNSVDVTISNEGSFPLALWNSVKHLQSSLFFNLGQEWELIKGIDFKNIFTLFSKCPKLVHVRLSDKSSGWRVHNAELYWNGFFYEVPEHLKGTMAGWKNVPSFNSTVFVKECMAKIDKFKDPEKQIRDTNPWLKELIHESVFGVYNQRMGSSYIKNIGDKNP